MSPLRLRSRSVMTCRHRDFLRSSTWWAVTLVAAAPLVAAPAPGHWAYQKPTSPTVPPVDATGADPGVRARNPIDAFVLARLSGVGLALAPQADRRTLIRRATIDLHGLPPTPREVANFVADARPDAYGRLLDRLLASPRYGERWARHWLDLARYAESDGYKSDRPRRGAWHYRDYVIRAFNADKPYDRFVREQLAGDELAPDDAEAAVATGFLRHWPLEDNGRQLPEMWQTILNEVTDVTGQVFLGLTVGCARCHDHKFDPIPQRDYYRLQAFFATMAPRDDILVGSPDELTSYFEKQRRWSEAASQARARLRDFEKPFLRGAALKKREKFPDEVQRIVAIPEARRSVREQQILRIGGAELHPSQKDMQGRMSTEDKDHWGELKKELAAFDALRPRGLPLARGIVTLLGAPPTTRIPDVPDAESLEPDFLSVLRSTTDARLAASVAGKSERRTALAVWLTSRENPLTARVMANRLWQHHFGRGLVATSEDFGVQGTPPSHPLLLDWLAGALVEDGWSLKRLHLLILHSHAYRQSTVGRDPERGRAVDPDNRLWWRRTARRLDAEVLRDSILSTSGELNHRMYGEGVYPELPVDYITSYRWDATKDRAQRNRRSCYLAVRRNAHLPLLKTFDVPDTFASCARRTETTTPAQALVLLNSRWVLEEAQEFAGRLLRESDSHETVDWIRRAFELLYGRAPTREELDVSKRFLRDESAILGKRLDLGEPVALPPHVPTGVQRSTAAALVDFCHSLWNTNEFLYYD